ncbi:hypothetical protein ACFY2Q_17240 [Micromonospora sp. NPDC000316]|uniref:hypothetical protein n=1 Tax=Micromonospora sp. NPDC000316 TaxID=3364216 RepID=UPI0036AC6BA2
MTDHYRTAPTATQDGAEQRKLVRPVLWLVLVVSAVINGTMSITGQNVFVSGAFGLVTLAAAVGLVVHHYRHRA